MRNRTVVGLGALALWWLMSANCHALAAAYDPQVTIVVSPNPALMDDRVTIKVMGLPPSRSVTIRARSKDQLGRWWRSSALFLARQDGSIDLSAQAPISGTYAGVDAMGLFWSMELDPPERHVPAFFPVVDWFKPIVTGIEAASGLRVLGATQVVRHFVSPGVGTEPFRTNGVVGTLYRAPAIGYPPITCLLEAYAAAWRKRLAVHRKQPRKYSHNGGLSCSDSCRRLLLEAPHGNRSVANLAFGITLTRRETAC